jgi:hypothetical protein
MKNAQKKIMRPNIKSGNIHQNPHPPAHMCQGPGQSQPG